MSKESKKFCTLDMYVRFYLNAFIVEIDGDGKYVHKYNYPAIFRQD